MTKSHYTYDIFVSYGLAGLHVELALECQPDGRLRGRNVRVLD